VISRKAENSSMFMDTASLSVIVRKADNPVTSV
jgi:hypothetical protein